MCGVSDIESLMCFHATAVQQGSERMMGFTGYLCEAT